MVELQDFEKMSMNAKARKALAEIKANNSEGLLVPSEIVAAATPDKHPLHHYFLWDDTEAANQYRLAQARAIVRKITVIGPDEENETMVPKYLSLSKDRNRVGGGYRETKEILNNKELLGQLEETAKKDIDGVLHRYEMLKSLCAKVRKAAGIKKAKRK